MSIEKVVEKLDERIADDSNAIRPAGATDFDDVVREHGLDAICTAIQAALASVYLTPQLEGAA